MTSLPVIKSSTPTHDNTMFTDFDRCKRLYYYRHILGLRRTGAQPALDWGSIMHRGLDVWYETQDPEKSLRAIADYEPYTEPEDDHRTKSLALLFMTEYMEYYRDDPSWQIHLTETPFELEDPNDGFRYGGIIDLLVSWNGNLWIVDHKTTSRGGRTYWDQFILSPQFTGYTWAGSILHGKHVFGGIVNRIVVNRVKKQPSDQFARQSFPYDLERIQEWKVSVLDKYREVEYALENDHFPVNWHGCVNKYGLCAFHSVCRASESSREGLLEVYTVHDPWHWEKDK